MAKTTQEMDEVLKLLEDRAETLNKAQINWKKTPKTRLTKGYLQARIKMVDEYWTSFRSAHDDLVKLTPKAQKVALPYFINEEFYKYEEIYNVLQGELKDLYDLTTSKSAPSNNMSSIPNNFVHLPKIQLPMFTSTYESWPAFKDLFSSLVHENAGLSPVQKLHYLKTSITGEAEGLLKHIQVTASNYEVAWNILNTRYGNKRLIVNNIMKRLFNQKKLNTQSAVQIKALIDTTTECLNNLENLKICTSSWDLIIIHLLVQKLDSDTHKEWEEHVSGTTINEDEELPTWNQFCNFMQTKFRTLELVTASTSNSKPIKERACHVATPVTEKCCVMCNENHTLCHCKEFIKMGSNERRQYVKNQQLCFNCLAPGHSVMKCKLPVSCRICRKRHHSLLHVNMNPEPAAQTQSPQAQPLASQHVAEEEEEVVQVNTMVASHLTARQGVALLATAVVEATSEQGHIIPLRALIDQGSQASFISEKAAQLLKLKRQSIQGSVVGVGSTKSDIKHRVKLQINSQWNQNYTLQMEAYVMSNLTTKIPAKTMLTQEWPHIKGLNLADPTYFKSGSVDLLLGVREYAQILQQELIKGPPGTPCAQKTSLGWILFGDIYNKTPKATYLVMHHQVDVDEMLKSIWELEPESKRQLTKDEKACEEIYERTTKRSEEGRYIVKLPFNTYSPQAPEGNTKEIAIRRFLQLERKFRRAPDLKKEYTKVINDYIEQKHMEVIPIEERETKRSVYLPHHAVVRDDKETSRTRVVFDASCKGTNNISLNQELHVGPQLQDDLRNLLIRWRMKRVCFMADIKQMYRQVLVSTEDADYQRILWRADELDDLNEYRLLRVTFGTAPAPYLAVRTLHQVADDEGADKPLAARSIKTNFYMDDWLDGADNVDAAKSLASDVSQILQRGGFELTKWSSNNVEFLRSIDQDKRSAKAHIDMNLDGTIKALGIVWNLSNDNLEYNLKLPASEKHVTKRGILSDIQKLFDPLGWIAPSTVLAKILMQKLWLEKLSWDDNVSEELRKEWLEIRNDFANVNHVQIPRWFNTTKLNELETELFGFSDASMRAYAAAVYIRTKTQDQTIKTYLVAARTRVAPLKTVSLPRLELLGLLLLSRLMKQVGQAMNIRSNNMYAWTDSSIVVAWMSGEPNRWKPFVANRVVEIAENLNSKQVYHVESSQNPADLASRGLLLSELKTSDLWWKGPTWLSETEIKFSKQEATHTEMEMKTTKIYTYLSTQETKSFTEEFEKFDNLTELLKTIIYCRRFLQFKKNTNTDQDITTQELEEALTICIKKVQREEYMDEIDRLKEGKQVKSTSPLKSLNPYLDEKQVLRVGGRLRHANYLSENQRHPMILGNKNMLTPLIIADAHIRTLHGGNQLMLSYLRSKYWIIKAKSSAKKYVRRCLICAKLRATAKRQLYGDLPAERVTPARPFLNSGVDFAGPFQILMSKGRGNRTSKAYVAIFVDLCTKAIHIELVGDLTSESFIGAYRRFVARRGKCSHLWSDQGRNFVGANKELKEAWSEANLQFTGEIAQTLATEGTQWHFIPAYSPSFGGLWETGVKSIKYHLRRIITAHLTYEEMTTVLCQVESCLNSRPLCPIDENDHDNTNPLTPGHFLIGEAPIVVPSPDIKNVKTSNLSRWQHTQKMLQDFWKRWQDEYLSRLQQRPKWLKKEEEFKIGDIVLIKVDNLPPGKWSLGRIVDKHPGSDGLTRVYSVKSGDSVTKRTITKLCALPIDSA